MPEYYLDIETKASDPEPDIENDEILTIQFQKLSTETGEKESDLAILKSWESSEENILQQFYSIFKPDNKWEFIPIGTNLNFDLFSLYNRWNSINIELSLKTLLYGHPYIDIQPILVILNKGIFSGASLQKFTGKKHSGTEVAKWYEKREYAAIEEYIRDEADRFIYLYQFLKRKSVDIRDHWFDRVLPNYNTQRD